MHILSKQITIGPNRIYIHCLLAINGISIIILSNDLYKFVISMIGSSYIIYLGISMLLSKKPELSNLDKHKSSYKNSILIGLVTNIFNVKAFLFGFLLNFLTFFAEAG